MQNDFTEIEKESNISHFNKSEIPREIVYPAVTDFINTHYRAYNGELHSLREYAQSINVPIILQETEVLLKSLLEIKKPKCIMEIGAAVGYSSIFFALSCPEAKVITVEKNGDLCKEARANIKKYALQDRITLIEGDAKEELPNYLDDSNLTIDCAFFDASKSHNKEFLDMIVPYCEDGALILTDNVLLKGLVALPTIDNNKIYKANKTSIRNLQDYIDYIHNISFLSSSIVAVGDGLALSVFKRG